MTSSNEIVDNISKYTVNIKKIDKDQAGQRLDNFLMKHARGAPRSLIYKVIRGGQVRVNSKRVKPSYRLVSEDLVRIPPISQKVVEKRLGANFINNIRDCIVFENNEFLILNKPPGLAVHRGSKISQDIITIFKSLPKYKEISPVNRLDKNTSGCMVFAKNYKSASAIGKCFQSGDVEKNYIALISGVFESKEIIVDMPLKRERKYRGRSTKIDESGKKSLSILRVDKRFKDSTLMKISLKTGRTHQIRVHVDSLGHPICGDTKYGDVEVNKKMREKGLKRMFLHSSELSFFYKQQYNFMAPLSKDLVEFVENLNNEL